MKTRIIHTKFWKDSFITALSPEERLGYLYYLTNDKVNIIHLYECSDREVIFDTGIRAESLTSLKEKLERNKKVFFFNNYVYLANAGKYESFTGEKNENAKKKLFLQINNDVLDWYNKIKNTIIDTSINRGIDKSISRSIDSVYKSKIINQKKEIVKQNTQKSSKEIALSQNSAINSKEINKNQPKKDFLEHIKKRQQWFQDTKKRFPFLNKKTQQTTKST